jgi:archaellum biogenesis protein FlaJ (TadC family)
MQDLRVSPATGIGHRLIKCLILIIVIILSSVNHLCEKINNESGVFNLHFVPFLRVVVSVFRLVLFQKNGTSHIKSSLGTDRQSDNSVRKKMY